MLNFAFTRGAMSSRAWWALVTPGLGIVWAVLACTVLGQGLEQILNPRLETHHLAVGAKMVDRGRARAELIRDSAAAAEGES